MLRLPLPEGGTPGSRQTDSIAALELIVSTRMTSTFSSTATREKCWKRKGGWHRHHVRLLHRSRSLLSVRHMCRYRSVQLPRRRTTMVLLPWRQQQPLGAKLKQVGRHQ
jgi:hypothetical protein